MPRAKRDFIHFRALGLRKQLDEVLQELHRKGHTNATLSSVARATMQKGLGSPAIKAELEEVHANVNAVTQRTLDRLCRSVGSDFRRYLEEELSQMHRREG